jgi:hypothetical protein
LRLPRGLRRHRCRFGRRRLNHRTSCASSIEGPHDDPWARTLRLTV